MAKQTGNNLKLGAFVIAGLLLLVITLYFIGRKHSMFGSSFYVKAKFKNVNGLMSGNNVRFAGIQAGTVKSIDIINDTLIEVTLTLEKKIKPHVHKNANVSIGTEGLMGNKVINITPGETPAPEVEEGDMLYTKKETLTEEMLTTLSRSNENVEVISSELKETVKRINNSKGIWQLLNDTTIPANLNASIQKIRATTANINDAAITLNAIVKDIHSGKGTLGMLVNDTTNAQNLKEVIVQVNSASTKANELINNLNSITIDLQQDIQSGNNTVHSLLKDSLLAKKLDNSMSNIENGTKAFNEDMNALKHNFLLRGYFHRQERKARKHKN